MESLDPLDDLRHDRAVLAPIRDHITAAIARMEASTLPALGRKAGRLEAYREVRDLIDHPHDAVERE